jgi:hypothetical protein
MANGNVQVPMSAPNSLQLNQLIGGAISPNLLAQHVQQQQPLNLGPNAQAGVAPNLLIGDYLQGNLGGVLNANVGYNRH